MGFPKENNLQWLRLLFAAQVLVVHAGEHLAVGIPGFIKSLPGVPAFFFVSGFLIYASYQNAGGRRYFENRFLRLGPGLVFVTLGSMAVVLLAHGWADLIRNGPTYATWTVAQLTLGQAYNPALFRDVGVGVINGSLWTLTTEILFYFSVPVIVWLERRWRHTLLILIALSFLIYVLGPLVSLQPFYGDKTAYDVIALTPIAWGWMFGFGILAVKHFDRIRPWLKRLPWLAIPALAMMLVGKGPLFGADGNRLGLFYFGCYVGLVLWLAFATPYRRLDEDLSYGVYIWHMPIINLLIVLAAPNAFGLAISLTLVLGAISWFLIEKPALKLKRKSLKPVEDLGRNVGSMRLR